MDVVDGVEIRLRKTHSDSVASVAKEEYNTRLTDERNEEEATEAEEISPSSSSSSSSSPYTLENFFWIVTALIVFYYTDFYAVVINDQRIYRTWLNAGFVLMTISLSVAFYLIVFLSFYKKVNPDEWESVHPAAIPIATGTGCSAIICFLVSLWPVWSILTPLILFTLVMGVIVVIAMLPQF